MLGYERTIVKAKSCAWNPAREQTHVGSRYTWKTHMRATRRVNIYFFV